MSFKSRDLSVLAYANGYTHWHYRTDDTYTEIDMKGYFNLATHMVRIGDTIIVNSTPEENTLLSCFLSVYINKEETVALVHMTKWV